MLPLAFRVISLQNIDFDHERRSLCHEHVATETHVFVRINLVHEVDPVNGDSHQKVVSRRRIEVFRVEVAEQILITAIPGNRV